MNHNAKKISKLAKQASLVKVSPDSEADVAEVARQLFEVARGGELTAEQATRLAEDVEAIKAGPYGSQLSDLMRTVVLPALCKMFDGKFVPN